MDFEQIIGLEVHCELKTHSKMFSGSPVTFGEDVNTNVNEIDIGMPGTLPSLNKRAVEFAIRVCYALHMDIDELLCFDRKNYYYSDLPKGFQITQERRPLGKNGYIDIDVDGHIKRVEITRLHLEEDTAKQFHLEDYSLIDYNRAGIPLIEVVTEPCLRNSHEAAAYLEKLRQIFLYTDVSDARLEEGSMRCDINISLRSQGSQNLGIRTEIKNLNSISHVQKAIEYEALRQERILKEGKEVLQETRRYDEDLKETVLMRKKGDVIDYKYYPEPNILPVRLDHQWVLSICNKLPMMPDDRKSVYINEHGLSMTDANILIDDKQLSDFYEQTIQFCQEYELICHWLLGDVSAYLNKYHITLNKTYLLPERLAKMICFIQDGTISSKQAKKVLEFLMKENKDPEIIIEENGWKQISDTHFLLKVIQETLDEYPQSVQDYIDGKDRVIGFLVGQVMKQTKGKANPQKTNQILLDLLKERKL